MFTSCAKAKPLLVGTMRRSFLDTFTRVDRTIGALLLALPPLTWLLAYITARGGYLFLPVPVPLVGVLASWGCGIAFVLHWKGGGLGRGVRWMFRLLMLAFTLITPISFLGFANDWGLRHHIQSVSSAETIQKLRHLAFENSKYPNDGRYIIDLERNELPARLGDSPWGLPGHAQIRLGGPADQHYYYVLLSWGGALVGHHELVVFKQPVSEIRPDMELGRQFVWLPGTYVILCDD